MSLAPLLAAGASPWQVVLSAQQGVLTRSQALRGGMSLATWRWRTSTRWQSPLPGIAVTHTGPVTDDEVRWCAVLVCGPGSALSAEGALVAQGWLAHARRGSGAGRRAGRAPGRGAGLRRPGASCS
ncbi:MAG: hypothetical protein M3P93_09875 [Actinomycetota bacterium]|nr:hypothetical protein [Actinomycetota bacterium]